MQKCEITEDRKFYSWVAKGNLRTQLCDSQISTKHRNAKHIKNIDHGLLCHFVRR